MTFAKGDIADFSDNACALQVEIVSYEIFRRTDEKGEMKDYERACMRVYKIFKDEEGKYLVGHEFVREKPLGSALEWSLLKADISKT